jgi:hypothetical protein
MKNKIELLEERVKNIEDIIGDFNDNITQYKVKDYLKDNEKFKNLADAISYLQKEASENDSSHFREIFKKCIKIILIYFS